MGAIQYHELYNREVIPLYPWNTAEEKNTVEGFGAAGRSTTLKAKVTHLRTAGMSSHTSKSNRNVLEWRAVQPPNEKSP